MKFFQSFRKRGFSLTLEILSEFKNFEAKEKDFFQALKSNESYLNEYYRVKQTLLDFNLVAYKLDGEYNKVIYLTEKGQDILEKINAIETMLTS
jgi:predicted transcriptional regulator